MHTGLNPGPLDLNQVDSFIAIHSDNTASVYSGRVDLGQGTPTGLLMIIGEELDMDLGQLKFIPSDTNVTPDTGVTVGSLAGGFGEVCPLVDVVPADFDEPPRWVKR